MPQVAIAVIAALQSIALALIALRATSMRVQERRLAQKARDDQAVAVVEAQHG